MSYLSPLRVHFAGRFEANVSTVNNDPGHFDNAAFLPAYQEMQTGTSANGWFNPQGDAAFRLLGCRVTSAFLATGAAKADDQVLSCLIADSDSQVCAKLVDLDPEQQLVSQIWGLQVRITNAQGETLLRGDFDPAPFFDIWDRASGSSGADIDAGAAYQSVLRNLRWGDISASAFLKDMKSAASDGLLSIKFNVDGFNLDFTSPDFMTGRIVGTIGPARADEPSFLVLGRHFMAAPGGSGFFNPIGGINFFVGVVDPNARCAMLDLGNALNTTTAGGPVNLGDLTLCTYDVGQYVANKKVVPVERLGVIQANGAAGYAGDPEWYLKTAGVVALPLSEAQLTAARHAPLALVGASSGSIAEWTTGVFLRADDYVYRLSPSDEVAIPVYATQFGRPLPNAVVNFVPDPSQLQPSNSINGNDVPPVATPISALDFNASATTDSKGVAVMRLKVSDPGTPRNFNGGADYGIDGQVYGVRPSFADPQYSGPVNQWDFISILLWSGFKASEPPTWDELQPIMQQYANLYPVMNRFLDMGDYQSSRIMRACCSWRSASM
jgi:hypothetical protein